MLHFTIANPEGYDLPESAIEKSVQFAALSGGSVTLCEILVKPLKTQM